MRNDAIPFFHQHWDNANISGKTTPERTQHMYLVNNNVPLFEWPTFPPQLSPIEHLWDYLGTDLSPVQHLWDYPGHWFIASTASLGLPWSTDLSPIEHLWDYIGQRISIVHKWITLDNWKTHYSRSGILHYSQTCVDEKTLYDLCCCTWWSYTLWTFYCDPMCLSCADELKLIKVCASFFVCCHYQSSIYCCSHKKLVFLFETQKIFVGGFSVLFSICVFYIVRVNTLVPQVLHNTHHNPI